MKIEIDDNTNEALSGIAFLISCIIIIYIISDYSINKEAITNGYTQTVKDNKVIWIKNN